jgi:hypothetical protein
VIGFAINCMMTGITEAERPTPFAPVWPTGD